MRRRSRNSVAEAAVAVMVISVTETAAVVAAEVKPAAIVVAEVEFAAVVVFLLLFFFNDRIDLSSGNCCGRIRSSGGRSSCVESVAAVVVTVVESAVVLVLVVVEAAVVVVVVVVKLEAVVVSGS